MGSEKTGAVGPDYSVRGVNPERLAAVVRHAGQNILDVGCGSGAYVLHLADRYRIRGVDRLRYDSWTLRPELFDVSDAHELKLPDAGIDTILSFETLEHLPEPIRALKEYFRVCRKNLIVTVPNCTITPGMRGSGIVYNHWTDRTHVNFWDLEGLGKDIGSLGFTIQHKMYINQVNLGPVMMEGLGLSGPVARYGAALFRRLQKHPYPMTCLIVAGKPGT